MLITLMPIGLAVVSLFPTKSTHLGLVIGVVTYCGMLVLLSNMGRDLGRNMEAKLFKKWKGSPTTRMLDPSTSDMPKMQLNKIHAGLEKLTGLSLPEDDNDARKDVFETWTTYLRINTRGQDNGQFRLILSENISFGFRRNLYGLRWYGLALTILALGVVIGDHTMITWGGAKPWHLDMLALRPVAKAAILITCWTLLILVFVVKEKWVKSAGEAYAKQLLEAVFILNKD